MSQRCFQCREAAKGVGCTAKGVCGKTLGSVRLPDLLLKPIGTPEEGVAAMLAAA